jgi:hypothetical protein
MNEAGNDARTGAAAIAHLVQIMVPAGARSEERQRFAVVPLSRANAFLVPLDSRTAARRSLSEYSALRPLPTRVVRRLLAAAWRLGIPEHLLRERAELPTGDETLLGHLRRTLDEPRLTFATGLRRVGSFYTPVLQLFRSDGTPVAYAKVGWDDVTSAQVRAESDALERVAAAPARSFHAPTVLWAGTWGHLELCVTAPLPRASRRVPEAALPPIDPLRDVAAVDGALAHLPVRQSSWWQRIVADADGLGMQVPSLAAHLARLDDEVGGTVLPFGRWHGDWVAWNMAQAPEGLYVWDWEYSRPAVPFGFDLLHFFFQEAFVRDHRPLLSAFAKAGSEAAAGLQRLGLGADDQAVLRLLHRLELRMRAERAVRRGAEADPGVRDTDISTLLAHSRESGGLRNP